MLADTACCRLLHLQAAFHLSPSQAEVLFRGRPWWQAHSSTILWVLQQQGLDEAVNGTLLAVKAERWFAALEQAAEAAKRHAGNAGSMGSPDPHGGSSSSGSGSSYRASSSSSSPSIGHTTSSSSPGSGHTSSSSGYRSSSSSPGYTSSSPGSGTSPGRRAYSARDWQSLLEAQSYTKDLQYVLRPVARLRRHEATRDVQLVLTVPLRAEAAEKSLDLGVGVPYAEVVVELDDLVGTAAFEDLRRVQVSSL